MFGNLKEFISVVQDGLSTNNNLRQTLQEVQKVKNIFKEKQKPVSEPKVNYGAGGELLEKYQQEWSELHKNADENARAAEEVDKVIVELHQTAKTRLEHANELVHKLSCVTNLTATVAECMDSLKNVQLLIRDVETELVDYEEFVERRKMEKWKLDHHYHLSLYKEKKFVALENTRLQLAKENSERNQERERKQLAELQSKRETSTAAFQNDLAQYLATGSLPTASGPVPDITLEQIHLDENRNDLEKFLDS